MQATWNLVEYMGVKWSTVEYSGVQESTGEYKRVQGSRETNRGALDVKNFP